MTAITVDDLNLSLGGLPILKDISFAIQEGQHVGLLGANGSGKTTLIRALLGLVNHQRGDIALFGQPLTSFRAWRQIGYVPQRASVSLHSTTVAEVVASGTLSNLPVGFRAKNGRLRVGRALEGVGLAGQANQLYAHLSAGQQQRALIARGIVDQPRLLIMDEPFTGVDLVAQAEIAAMLAESGATILVVLHETGAWSRIIERNLILRQGRLVDDAGATSPITSAAGETTPPERTRLLSGMEPPWTF